jgi:hypothetical protein
MERSDMANKKRIAVVTRAGASGRERVRLPAIPTDERANVALVRVTEGDGAGGAGFNLALYIDRLADGTYALILDTPSDCIVRRIGKDGSINAVDDAAEDIGRRARVPAVPR